VLLVRGVCQQTIVRCLNADSSLLSSLSLIEIMLFKVLLT
jgi:hypothetical protein